MAEKSFTFAIPGDLATPTGGYAYDRRLIQELGQLGWRVDHLRLPDGFPMPTGDALAETARLFGALQPGGMVMVDGLALGAMPAIASRLAERHALIALLHHPLALETGLDPGLASALARSERDALAHARHVIVTSPATRDIVREDFDVPAERLTVAVPGTDPVRFAGGSSGGPPRLLAVGSVVPRKGYLDLIAALAPLTPLPWRLDVAGSTTLDPDHVAEVRHAIRAAGLDDRVRLIGAVGKDELAALHDEADVFVLASHYEGYGMAFAEAIAYGLPVVGTTGGAIPGTVGEAAVLVPPGDVAALGAALRQLIQEPATRMERAEASRAAAARLPRWRNTAEIVATVLERFS